MFLPGKGDTYQCREIQPTGRSRLVPFFFSLAVMRRCVGITDFFSQHRQAGGCKNTPCCQCSDSYSTRVFLGLSFFFSLGQGCKNKEKGMRTHEVCAHAR